MIVVNSYIQAQIWHLSTFYWQSILQNYEVSRWPNVTRNVKQKILFLTANIFCTNTRHTLYRIKNWPLWEQTDYAGLSELPHWKVALTAHSQMFPVECPWTFCWMQTQGWVRRVLVQHYFSHMETLWLLPNPRWMASLSLLTALPRRNRQAIYFSMQPFHLLANLRKENKPYACLKI